MSEPASPSNHLTVEEQLAVVPPARFVAERARLAAAIARAGDRAGAAAVKKLRKPSRSVWVLNQLARDAEETVAKLFGASDALHGTQSHGDGDATSSWRASLARQRVLFDSLVAQARQLLKEADEAADEATMARVARGLRAAAAGGSVRKALMQGRLTEDPAEPGFMDLGASVLESRSPPPREGGRDAEPLATPTAKQAGANQAAAKQAAAKQAAAKQAGAKQATLKAPIGREEARQLKKLEAALAEAERAAARAAEEASEAEQAWTLAQEAERAARAQHTEAKEEVDRARHALAAAESLTRSRAADHAARERELSERDKARVAAAAHVARAEEIREEIRRKAAAALEHG